MVDIDSEGLFNGAAAVVSTIAVLVFLFNVEFAYSPVSKFGLVVVFLTGVFAITQRTDDYQLTVLGYGVIVVSALALFFDVVNTFDLGNTPTVLGLLVIAGALFVVRRYLDEDNHFVTSSKATYALGFVAVVVVAILAIDVVTGGLAYELRADSAVEVSTEMRGPTVVGTIVVTNPTPLPERVDVPNYEVCTAGNWSAYRRPTDPNEPERPVRANVYVQDGYNDHVLGYGTKRYPIELNVDGANMEGTTFPVEVTDQCPDVETGQPYLALYERQRDVRYGRPV